MLICVDCWRTFEPEEAHIEREYHNEVEPTCYEEFSSCPYCKSDYIDEAYQCSICGEWHMDEDLYYDICQTCLEDKLTPENFLLFATSGYDENEMTLLEDFYLWVALGYHTYDVPLKSNPTIKINIINSYLEVKEENPDELLKKIKEFVKLLTCFWDDFADFVEAQNQLYKDIKTNLAKEG